MCTFEVEKTPSLAWELSDGLEIHDIGPHTDHTTNSTYGKFVVSYCTPNVLQ